MFFPFLSFWCSKLFAGNEGIAGSCTSNPCQDLVKEVISQKERGLFSLSVICFLFIYFLLALQEEIWMWVFKVKHCFPVFQTCSSILTSSCFSLDEYKHYLFCEIYKDTHKFLQSSVGIWLVKNFEICYKNCSSGVRLTPICYVLCCWSALL